MFRDLVADIRINLFQESGRDQLFAGDSEQDVPNEDAVFTEQADFPDLEALSNQKRSITRHEKRWGFDFFRAALNKV